MKSLLFYLDYLVVLNFLHLKVNALHSSVLIKMKVRNEAACKCSVSKELFRILAAAESEIKVSIVYLNEECLFP